MSQKAERKPSRMPKLGSDGHGQSARYPAKNHKFLAVEVIDNPIPKDIAGLVSTHPVDFSLGILWNCHPTALEGIQKPTSIEENDQR
jgi:hypothetical protein